MGAAEWQCLHARALVCVCVCVSVLMCVLIAGGSAAINI